MTQGAPAHLIFDRSLQRRRLARAYRQGVADFLFVRALDELAFRLAGVQRPFARALDLGAPLPGTAQALAAPERQFMRLAPIFETARAGDVVGEEEAIPFGRATFDLVTSVLTLQSVNDAPGLLAQARRLLAADGLFIGACLGGRSLHELRAALIAAEVELTGGASPRVAPFADVRDFGALLQRAGFALPVADSETIIVRYDHLIALMRDLRAFGATNALRARARKALSRAIVARAAQIYAERFSDADGRMRATFELIWFAGWAPHQSQQKPLAPGSAKMRLAEILTPPAAHPNEEQK